MKLLSTILTFIIFIQFGNAQRKLKNHYLVHVKTEKEITNLEIKVERAYNMLLGHFTNKAQADTSSNNLYREQEIISVPLWSKRKGEYWMYMSWYPANNIENPLAQLVYKIEKYRRDTFKLIRYGLPEEMRGNIWAYNKELDKFKPKDLIETNCINYLVTSEESFISQPRSIDELCPEAEGAAFAYLQTEGRVSASHIVLIGTFYDKAKNILFTQRPKGIHFDRRDKRKPKYLDILYKKKKKSKKKRKAK